MIIFNFCIVFYLKHMINNVLNFFSKNSCETVDKKILINNDDNLLLLFHDQTTIQYNVNDIIKNFCYLFHISNNVIIFSH